MLQFSLQLSQNRPHCFSVLSEFSLCFAASAKRPGLPLDFQKTGFGPSFFVQKRSFFRESRVRREGRYTGALGAFLFGFLKVQLEVDEVVVGVFLVGQSLLDDPDGFIHHPVGSTEPDRPYRGMVGAIRPGCTQRA